MYSEILADATNFVIYRRFSNSPWQVGTQAPIRLVRTCVGNVAPLGCVRLSLRAAISEDSRFFIAIAGLSRIETETIGFPCANPIIPIRIKWTLGGIGLRRDNDVVTLPNSNKHRCVLVRMNWYEISTNNLKPVIVDGKDKC